MTHLRTPLYRNAYALMLSNAVTSGLGFVFWIVAAQLYSTELVGIGAAIVSSMLFISGMSQLNMIGVLTRFIPAAGRGTHRLVGLAYISAILMTLVTALVFVLGLSIWAPAGFPPVGFLFGALFVGANIAYTVFALQEGVLTGLRRTVWVPVVNAGFSIVKIGLLVLFVTTLPDYGIFASWSIPVALVIVPMNLWIFSKLIPQHAEATQHHAIVLEPRRIVSFIMSDYVAAMMGRVAIAAVPLIIIAQVGSAENAYYAIAWTISFSLQLISINMASSLTVETAANEAQFGEYGRRALKQLAWLLVPIVLFVVVFAPYIMHLFGADYAEHGANALRLLALAALSNAVIALYTSYARMRRQLRGVIIANAVLMVLVIGLSYLFVGTYGITSIAAAWFFGQTLLAAILFATVLRPILRPPTNQCATVPADVA